MSINGLELEEKMDAAAIAFSRYFCAWMDGNGWSHPQLVALCKKCTGDKALFHSSQIAGLRAARLKSPGPRSFVALEYLMRAIESLHKVGFTEGKALFGELTHLVEHAEIMRDEEGNPATTGFLLEVFVGLRPVPIDLSKIVYNEKQADDLSNKAGRLLRKLMAIQDMDPISDAGVVATKYQGTQQQRTKLAGVIKGVETWDSEEIEEVLGRLSKLLREEFSYNRSASELKQELS